MMEILPGAFAGGALVWLLRHWISERLKQSISHEYSSKLENLKIELNAKLEAVKHDYEVHQLRTSLFFDHQRAAFAEILEKVAATNQEWWRTGYDSEIGLCIPVPHVQYRLLKELYFKHQLFLDAESIMAMELLFEVYQDSFPFDDGSGGDPIQRDVQGPFNSAEYLQPRLAALFQQKIGVASDARPVRQIALLGAIRILNRYHFADIDLPAQGSLKLGTLDGPAAAVMKAERHFAQLIEKMRQFNVYLQTETGFFHEAEVSLGRYLAVLENTVPIHHG
jgi:hypothetical protein